jgi:hypothetical protein
MAISMTQQELNRSLIDQSYKAPTTPLWAAFMLRDLYPNIGIELSDNQFTGLLIRLQDVHRRNIERKSSSKTP